MDLAAHFGGATLATSEASYQAIKFVHLADAEFVGMQRSLKETAFACRRGHLPLYDEEIAYFSERGLPVECIDTAETHIIVEDRS